MHKTLIVTDTDSWPESLQGSVISFATYLTDYPKKDEPSTKVINLCDTEHYLSQGYYCSLLAEARQHKVMPSVKLINALRTNEKNEAVLMDVTAQVVDTALHDDDTHYVFFGQSETTADAKIAANVFQTYPAPLLKWQWATEATSRVKQIRVQRAAMSELSTEQSTAFWQALEQFTEQTAARWAKQRDNLASPN